MNIPINLLYSKDHEWLRIEDEYAYVGVTDFAQESLGDIVYIDIDYEEGDSVDKDEPFGSIEAVKTVSDLFMPISGEIVEINQELESDPELVNSSTYEEGWIIKIKIESKEEVDSLYDSASYEKLITG